jgi:hypothetical protein
MAGGSREPGSGSTTPDCERCARVAHNAAVIALLTFFAWGFFGSQPSWVCGLINAASVISNALRLRAASLRQD